MTTEVLAEPERPARTARRTLSFVALRPLRRDLDAAVLNATRAVLRPNPENCGAPRLSPCGSWPDRAMHPERADRCLAAELHLSERHPGGETKQYHARNGVPAHATNARARTPLDKLCCLTDAARRSRNSAGPGILRSRPAVRIAIAVWRERRRRGLLKVWEAGSRRGVHRGEASEDQGRGARVGCWRR